MRELSTDRLLERLEAEADKQATPLGRGKPRGRSTELAMKQGAELLDLMVRAGVASGTSVRVGGIRYEFTVEDEAITDSTSDRQAHALIRAGREAVAPNPSGDDVAPHFVKNFTAIATAFAERAIHDLDHEMHPRSSWIGRVEIACGLAAEGMLGEPGGIVDTAVDDLTNRMGDEMAQRAIDLRPVAVASRVVRGIASAVFGSNLRTGVATLATGGAATLLGAPAMIILGALAIGVVKEIYEKFRERHEERHLTEAARAQLTLKSRISALEKLEALATPDSGFRPVVHVDHAPVRHAHPAISLHR